LSCCCSILVKSEVFIVTSHSSGASRIWSWHVDGFTIQSFKVCLLSGPGVSVTISALSAAAKTPQELPVSFLSLSYSCICNYNQHQNRQYFTATAKRDTKRTATEDAAPAKYPPHTAARKMVVSAGCCNWGLTHFMGVAESAFFRSGDIGSPRSTRRETRLERVPVTSVVTPSTSTLLLSSLSCQL
jgi:hypothetical protein